jgi:hypothetical protein
LTSENSANSLSTRLSSGGGALAEWAEDAGEAGEAGEKAVPGDLKIFAEVAVGAGVEAEVAIEFKLLELLELLELKLELAVLAVGLATGAALASGRCDILASASGEMATISTPSAVSRVDNTKASPPTCSRTSLSASVVVAAMILWGAI